MPSFTATQPGLRADGPVVSLQIVQPQAVVTAMQGAGQPVPPPVPATALVDTGAGATSIQTGIAATLGLNPVGVTTVNTPSSSGVSALVYPISLILPNGLRLDGVNAIEMPLIGQNIECLIGRDVLSQAVLVYIGYTNTFTISF